MPALKRFLPFILVLVMGLFACSPAAQAAPDIKDVLKQVEPAVGIVWVQDQKGEVRGHGSGFFLTADGEFITNRHVLEGAYSAYVEMANGKKLRVNKILASNPQLDMVKVLVETRGETMPFLKVAASLPERGDRVLIYGNPIKFNFVLTEGIVSAIQQYQREGGDTWIQFTAPISPGNSGGPLINMNAEVVGIATWVRTDGQNLNFALPMYELKNLTDYASGPDYAPPGSEAPMIPQKGAVQREKPAVPVVLITLYGSSLLREYQKGVDLIYEKIYNKVDRKKYTLRDYYEVKPLLLKYLDGYVDPRNDIDFATVSLAGLVDFGRKAGIDYFFAVSVSTLRSGYHGGMQKMDLKMIVKIVDVAQGQYIYYNVLEGSATSNGFFAGDLANAERAGFKALDIVLAQFDKEVKFP